MEVMRIHPEGHKFLRNALLVFIILDATLLFLLNGGWKMSTGIGAGSILTLFLLGQFFRVPTRSFTPDENDVLAPADGRIVAHEEVEGVEYFNDKRIQVSIFMSPFVPHINWFPINGEIPYMQYHPGRFLVAWHPKSSTENESNSLVIQKDNGQSILCRQIAGAVARRIVCYADRERPAIQGAEMGFIKFGSRVDLFLPLGTAVKVGIGEAVTGSETVIARLNE